MLNKIRIIAVSLLTLSLLVVGGIFLIRHYREVHLYKYNSTPLSRLQTELIELNQREYKFGDFVSQDIDEYIANLYGKHQQLEYKLNLLRLKDDISKTKTPSNFTNRWRKEITPKFERYSEDVRLIKYAGLDWKLFGSNPDRKKQVKEFWQWFAQYSWTDNHKPNYPYQPARVEQGQVIGLQGCTGVCSGTHLHFSIIQDNVAQNPCKLLPQKLFSRWGVRGSCGINNKTKLIWPLPEPWIITQLFEDLSPVTYTKHIAIDLIDRDQAPVLASHGGWYYPFTKPCIGARICNGKRAKLAMVCEEKGCRSGLVTEYWHLDWMMLEDVAMVDKRKSWQALPEDSLIPSPLGY